MGCGVQGLGDIIVLTKLRVDPAPFLRMEKVALAGADLVFMDDKHCQSSLAIILEWMGIAFGV